MLAQVQLARRSIEAEKLLTTIAYNDDSQCLQVNDTLPGTSSACGCFTTVHGYDNESGCFVT